MFSGCSDCIVCLCHSYRFVYLGDMSAYVSWSFRHVCIYVLPAPNAYACTPVYHYKSTIPNSRPTPTSPFHQRNAKQMIHQGSVHVCCLTVQATTTSCLPAVSYITSLSDLWIWKYWNGTQISKRNTVNGPRCETMKWLCEVKHSQSTNALLYISQKHENYYESWWAGVTQNSTCSSNV